MFYFAGHGYSALGGSGDESGDDWDDCLVCADRLLLDHWFHDVFWTATQPGSFWVNCVDACHSATSTLAIDVFHDPPPDHAIRELPLVDGPRWRLLLAACGDGEEALKLDDRNGMARGAVTDAMLRSVKEFPDATYARLWGLVADRATAIRNTTYWIGTPTIWASGPDQTLSESVAFAATRHGQLRDRTVATRAESTLRAPTDLAVRFVQPMVALGCSRAIWV